MAAGIATFIVGTTLLYFGGTMTFLVPGYPGESFFQKDRLLLGIVPLLAALALFILAAWFFRSIRFPKASGPTLPVMIAYFFFGAIGVLWLSFVVAALVHHR
jgi:hypothetical protein